MGRHDALPWSLDPARLQIDAAWRRTTPIEPPFFALADHA
jgi:hypothetical protein